MKIIDRHGKLFGLVSIIDLSFLLLFIVGIMVLHNAYLEYRKPQYDYESYYSIKVLYFGLLLELADAMKAGDGNPENAQIVNIVRADVGPLVDPAKVVKAYDSEGGSIRDYNVTATTIVTYRAKCFVKHDTIFRGKHVMKINHPFTFETKIYTVDGLIIAVEKDERKSEF